MIDLLPHQLEDSEKMVKGGNALNWSGMGTGKTLTSLNAFRVGGFERGLVIAPPIALPMWVETITEFTGMSAVMLTSGRTPIIGEPDFVVTTYSLASGGQQESLEEYFYSDVGQALILDEAHNCKNKDAKRTKAVFGPACTGRNGLFELFDDTWSLTGTPVLRYYDDLYAQLRATKPNVLREFNVDTYDKFRLTFCVTQLKKFHPRQRPQATIVANKNSELMRRLIEACDPIRRTLKEVADAMPPVTYRNIAVENAAIRSVAHKLKGVNVEEALAAKDESMVKHWKELGELRLKETCEYVRDCAGQSPVLVGHWFREHGDAIAMLLKSNGLTVAQVNGSTPQHKREEIRIAFNAGHLDCLIGQISAMNTSWNIQEAAHHVIMAEDHPSPGLVDQFIGRVFRMGQKNHVQVDFIKSMVHPIDKALTELRGRKSSDVAKVM